MPTLIDALGWAGSLMLLAAYAGVSGKKLDATSALYQALNAAGSGCLIANTAYHGAFPPALLNSVWAVIAVLALVRRARSSGAAPR